MIFIRLEENCVDFAEETNSKENKFSDCVGKWDEL